ncbi:hypothetical protein BC941DRAFT_18207 [Chlamydoabsidia padenii]|nr:hypothetical protein BC941DRAFT_18207 [Chlamydoabsidia padenii]
MSHLEKRDVAFSPKGCRDFQNHPVAFFDADLSSRGCRKIPRYLVLLPRYLILLPRSVIGSFYTCGKISSSDCLFALRFASFCYLVASLCYLVISLCYPVTSLCYPVTSFCYLIDFFNKNEH